MGEGIKTGYARVSPFPFIIDEREKERNYKGKANLNRKTLKENWLGAKVNLNLGRPEDGQSNYDYSISYNGEIVKIDCNSGGYFFKGNRKYYQIPLKRVTITNNSIEGILISTEQTFFEEKGVKVFGVIKKI